MNIQIDESTHWDMTNNEGTPLVCDRCGTTQTTDETAIDPLMYTDCGYENITCDGCAEQAANDYHERREEEMR